MPQYWILETAQAIKDAVQESSWSVWAKLPDRDDWTIYAPEGVRERDGVLEINAGEWQYGQGYLSEEWVRPSFVFAKHSCEGCHYPPHMCCLQPSDLRGDDSFDGNSDEDIMGSDAYRAAEAARDRPPVGAILKDL